MLQIDSRKVTFGDTFLALRGVNHDGHDYIQDAIKNGAQTIIAEEGLYEVDTLVVKNTHDYLIEELNRLYGDELKDLVLIGVTGTNGKTTTCSLIWQALKEQGEKCGYIGTIGFYIDDFVRSLSNTTPDVYEIYEMLLECKKEGCKYVAMEVSSHALSYNRIGKLKYDIAVFTNLTEDHLDFHKSMEEYAQAKQILFKNLKEDGKAIINIDDKYKDYYLLEQNDNITYGCRKSDYRIHDITLSLDETNFYLNDEQYKSKLLGNYNIYNLTTAIITLKLLGKDINTNLLEAPTGRLDVLKKDDKTVMIDYAHTPDAVMKVLENLREFSTGKIVTIIGCGGNREKDKRPKMGRIASELSDLAIFTSDNPRFEDPKEILKDMTTDLTKDNVIIVENRKEAILKGLQKITKNDILLILGKGHETYQVIGDQKIEFNDRLIVEEL